MLSTCWIWDIIYNKNCITFKQFSAKLTSNAKHINAISILVEVRMVLFQNTVQYVHPLVTITKFYMYVEKTCRFTHTTNAFCFANKHLIVFILEISAQ